MDLGISGRRALVCASSKGLGLACATALAQEGCLVTLNGRDETRLKAAAQTIKDATGILPEMIVADLNNADDRARLLAICDDIDILVNNNGGPPPSPFLSTSPADWQAALESNLLVAVQFMQAVLPGMQSRKFGRIVNITSAMVKTPHPMMTLSTAPRAGLTAITKAVSRDVAADNITINNMLPERLNTDRQKYMVAKMAGEQNKSEEVVREQVTQNIPAKRFGDPDEFGATCAFLCSAKAGFITGQNVQLDGGAYTGIV